MWSSIRYACFVLKHKWYVLVFGRKVGGIPLRQLLIHDMSKFSRAEFPAYRRRSFEGLSSKSPEFQKAWRHHWLCNPHHWEYWANHADGWLRPMPEVYVREMVADWQAANKTYGSTYGKAVPIDEWFAKEYPRMDLHWQTVATLRPLIAPIGLSIPEHKKPRG
jgi:hypothetical protein